MQTPRKPIEQKKIQRARAISKSLMQRDPRVWKSVRDGSVKEGELKVRMARGSC